MSEQTSVPADRRFRHALRLIWTARQTRLYAQSHGPRVRHALDQLADDHSRAAMELVAQA